MNLLRWAFLGSLALVACTAADGASKRKKGEVFVDDTDNTVIGQPQVPDVIEDAGIFDLGARPNTSDAGSRQRPADAGPLQNCTGTLKAGDLVVVEVMVASRSGSSDPGEWVEIMNTRDCRLQVNGVRVDSPRGTTETDSVTIGETLLLDPYETFVVAGSANAAENNALPGKILPWAKTDVLKNTGDAIRIMGSSGTVLDEFVYPEFSKLPVGTSFTFPDGCKLTDRYVSGNPSVWTKKWSLALGSWKSGFKGTPNEPNVDVGCAP